MKQELFVVIAYDIVSDRRRDKIVKVLKDYGRRVNYSVFECIIKTSDYLNLKQTLIKLIKDREDTILMYEICSACKRKMDYIGIKKIDYIGEDILMV